MKERAEPGPCCGSEEGLLEETKGNKGRGTLREDRVYWLCHVTVRKEEVVTCSQKSAEGVKLG